MNNENNKVIISSNENKNKPFIFKLVSILETMNKVVSFERLDSADIVYGKVGIELKLTASDFLSSCNKELGESSSRLERQVLNLSQFEQPYVFICATIPEIIMQMRKNLEVINSVPTPRFHNRKTPERKTWNFNSINGIMSSLESRYKVFFIPWGKIGAEEHVAKILTKSNDNKQPNVIPIRSSASSTDRQIAMMGICEGVGKEAARNLLVKFKTIKNISNATQPELKKVKLIGPTLSETIHNTFNKEFNPRKNWK